MYFSFGEGPAVKTAPTDCEVGRCRLKPSPRSRFGLAPAPGRQADEVLRFHKSLATVPFRVTQTVARSLGIRPEQMVPLVAETGGWLFHFWGTVWGELLAAFLRALGHSAETVNEFCLYLYSPLTQLPAWDEKVGQKIARDAAVVLAGRLAMGRFHEWLPASVAIPAALRQFNLARFSQLYRAMAIVNRPDLYEQLDTLAH